MTEETIKVQKEKIYLITFRKINGYQIIIEFTAHLVNGISPICLRSTGIIKGTECLIIMDITGTSRNSAFSKVLTYYGSHNTCWYCNLKSCKYKWQRREDMA